MYIIDVATKKEPFLFGEPLETVVFLSVNFHLHFKWDLPFVFADRQIRGLMSTIVQLNEASCLSG